jgi:hypothetical protein
MNFKLTDFILDVLRGYLNPSLISGFGFVFSRDGLLILEMISLLIDDHLIFKEGLCLPSFSLLNDFFSIAV